MPSQKHKGAGKIQPKQEVEKVKVKSEPIDILPMAEYVDDRVELIRQAFQCLKPKSIKAIAPDFMQSKPIEKIQEQCLNEVLGMSKKRLLAIINATKCPTDTESSSDEETVKPIEEHISLDEISSEDERPKGVGKKKQKKSEKKEEKPAPMVKKKEYSVLELLELQARARAIRSQLALEPVTKIEIKESDEEDEVEEQPPKINSPIQPSEPIPTKSSNSISSQSSAKSLSARTIRTVTEVSKTKEKTKDKVKEFNKNGVERLERSRVANESQTVTERRIKLKRNWKKRSQDEEIAAQDSPSNLVIVVKNPAVQIQPEPEEERERSGSPDVLPIVPSPETLCISSDTDEEAPTKEKSEEKQAKEAPVVLEKRISPPKESSEELKNDEALEEGEVLDELELTIHEDDENLEAVITDKTPRMEERNLEMESKKSSEENTVSDVEKSTTEEEKKMTEDEKSDDDLNDDCIEIECTDILEEHQENPEQKDESDTQNKTEPEEEILELNDSSDEDNLPLSQLVGEKGVSSSKANNN